MEQKNPVLRLVESAIMIALATVLSILPLVHLPYGGSITMASMLPLLIIAYRHGTTWGIFCGLVYGIIQMLLGLKNFSYVPQTFVFFVVLALLDYLVAFTVIGFGGSFRRVKNQASGMVLGAVLLSVLRYACHVLSGYTVWASFELSKAGLLYSLSYNATYMLPEMLILMIAAYYIGSFLDFRRNGIHMLPSTERNTKSPVLGVVGGMLIAGSVIFDVVHIFSKLQNPDSGELDVTMLAQVNWIMIAAVTAVALVAGVTLFIVQRQINKEANKDPQ